MHCIPPCRHSLPLPNFYRPQTCTRGARARHRRRLAPPQNELKRRAPSILPEMIRGELGFSRVYSERFESTVEPLMLVKYHRDGAVHCEGVIGHGGIGFAPGVGLGFLEDLWFRRRRDEMRKKPRNKLIRVWALTSQMKISKTAAAMSNAVSPQLFRARGFADRLASRYRTTGRCPFEAAFTARFR